MILLHRIDPALNMRRYCRVRIAPDLFGEFSLQRVWGRIDRGGQAKNEWSYTRAQAREARRRPVRAKLRKGYLLVRRPADREAEHADQRPASATA